MIAPQNKILTNPFILYVYELQIVLVYQHFVEVVGEYQQIGRVLCFGREFPGPLVEKVQIGFEMFRGVNLLSGGVGVAK